MPSLYFLRVNQCLELKKSKKNAKTPEILCWQQSDEEDISILSTVAYLNLLFIHSSMMYNVEKNEKQQ